MRHAAASMCRGEEAGLFVGDELVDSISASTDAWVRFPFTSGHYAVSIIPLDTSGQVTPRRATGWEQRA